MRSGIAVSTWLVPLRAQDRDSIAEFDGLTAWVGAWGSLDDLVGAGEQRRRKCAPKGVRCVLVEEKLKFYCLYDCKVRYVNTFEDASSVMSGFSKGVGNISCVTHYLNEFGPG